MKANIVVIVLLAIAILGAATWFLMTGAPVEEPAIPAPVVLSFEACAAAGYPVMESYPRRCATPDGRTYVEELPAPEPTYLNSSADLIRVTTPTPGAVTGKEVTVMGEARGTWYFEASFPIEIRDTTGAVIARGQGTAQSDWMTTSFVPFKATLTAPTSFIGDAVLILKNDNPSGLPENERSISFPIRIEY